MDEPGRWAEILAGMGETFFYSHFHSWQMSKTIACPVFLHLFTGGRMRVVITLAEREKEVGIPDLFTPYGVGGFLGDLEILDNPDFYNVFTDFGRRRNASTAYIFQNPFRRLHGGFAGEFLSDHRTFYRLNLSLDPEDIWNGMSKQLRNDLRHLQSKRKYNLVEGSMLLEKDLIRCYRETFERTRPSASYDFDAVTLSSYLHSSHVFALGASHAGRVEAISLFIVEGQTAEYFMNATTAVGRGASKLLIWKAIAILKKNGIRKLNLGGGAQEGDGLDNFKRRFGGLPAKGQSLKFVFPEGEYDKLCMKYAPKVDFEYFPPYWKAED